MDEIEEDLANAMKEVGKSMGYMANQFVVSAKTFSKIINLTGIPIYSDEDWIVERNILKESIEVYKIVDDDMVEKSISDLPENIRKEVTKELI